MRENLDPTIRAGALRRRITIYSKGGTSPVSTDPGPGTADVVDIGAQTDTSQLTQQDSFGGEVKNWTEFYSCWAHIEPLYGRKNFTSTQLYDETRTVFTLRYLKGIDTTMKIEDEYSNQYEIVSAVDIEGRHRMLEILAVQRPQGREI